MSKLMRLLKIYTPFTYMWVLRKIIGNPKTVLDLGCGDGELMKIIGDKSWEMEGIDIYPRSIEKAMKTGMYNKIYKGDLSKIASKLTKQKKKYDVVFCSQVIEHITRKDGEAILDAAEKLAIKRIYFGTPRGFMTQPEDYIQGNPHQKHKSGWYIDDFTQRGYTVYGVGLPFAWSEGGKARGSNKLASLIIAGLSYIMAPVLLFFPQYAAGMMAVKKNNENNLERA